MYHNVCRRAYSRKVAQTSEEAEAGRSEQQETHKSILILFATMWIQQLIGISMLKESPCSEKNISTL